MLENPNSGSSMLEHWKILHDRAFARAFDQKCTIFAKMCLFSKAVLHRVWKNRASSGLEHAQKWKFEHRACSIIKNWLRTGIFRARACSGATLYTIFQIETQVILNSTLKIHASWHVSKWAGKKKSHSFNEPSRGCISTQGAWMSVICSSRVNNKKSRIETCFNFVQTHPLKKSSPPLFQNQPSVEVSRRNYFPIDF